MMKTRQLFTTLVLVAYVLSISACGGGEPQDPELAAFTKAAVSLPGIGDIEQITLTVPETQVGPVYFGIWAPRGIPQDVVDTMGKVWDSAIRNSDRLAKYAQSKGLAVNVVWGDEAYAQAFPSTQINAWQIHDGGKSKVSPDTIGIPRP